MNILIIAAHPDDEVLGMGGTIAKHTSQHDNVSIIYMATGISARRELSESEYEMLLFLAKLLAITPLNAKFKFLNNKEQKELINWDKEIHRKKINY